MDRRSESDTGSAAPILGNIDASALLDLAFFHEPYWHDYQSNAIKTLLLFFDGIALLVPDYMRERPLDADPTLAQPLAEQGLLHILSPEKLVDVEMAKSLADLFERLFAAGAFDRIDRKSPLYELSSSRLGLVADPGLMEPVVNELRTRGLAGQSTDGVSVPIQEDVRALILATLGQLLRRPAEALGYALQPLGQERRAVRGLLATLNEAPVPTAGHVVVSDLHHVTFDLSSVALGDVLAFREEHGAAYRAYARDLRSFVRSLSVLDEEERTLAYADRREELSDTADDLRRLARTAWRRPMAAFSLGIVGAALAVKTGNPIGAGVAFASGLLGLKRHADPASAYLYLFEAQRTWPPRYLML